MENKTQILSQQKSVLLCLVMGVITTVVGYEGFGTGDQVVNLPLIMRSLDKSFLPNDFYTNEGAHSIARYFFTQFIALISGSAERLPLVYLCVSFISNISISLITFYFARDYFNRSNLAGIYASALTLSIQTFSFGYLPVVYLRSTIPMTVAIPLILLATLTVARGNLIVGLTICGIASLIHPVTGLQTGGLLWLVFILTHLLGKKEFNGAFWKQMVVSSLVFGAFALISIVPQFSQTKIDTDRFIYIMAHVRAPHFYLPSTFTLKDYVSTFFFLMGISLLFYRRQSDRNDSFNLFIGVVSGAILFLCVLGYVFVDLFPVRILATAEPLRLNLILKWFGLILIGGSMAGTKMKTPEKTLYISCLMNPITIGLAEINRSLKDRFNGNKNWLNGFLAAALLLTVTFLFLKGFSLPVVCADALLVSYILLIFLSEGALNKKITYSILITGLFVLLVFLVLPGARKRLFQNGLMDRFKKTLSLKIDSELGPGGDEIAVFARNNLPTDTILLTPLDWGQFRIQARRAIVVDWKAFPYTDIGMLEWYDRIVDCYGDPKTKGLGMAKELNDLYKGMNDQKLLELKKKYGFSYAVLYIETPTKFKVIHSSGNYNLISVAADPPHKIQTTWNI